jgi:hypothetical protein
VTFALGVLIGVLAVDEAYPYITAWTKATSLG